MLCTEQVTGWVRKSFTEDATFQDVRELFIECKLIVKEWLQCFHYFILKILHSSHLGLIRKTADLLIVHVSCIKKSFEVLQVVSREVDVHFLEADIVKCYLHELLDLVSKFLYYSNKTRLPWDF